MANIGQFTATTEWQKLDDLTGYTFENNKDYTIQNKGYNALLVCEGVSSPTIDDTGFILQSGESFGYTCKSGEYCWIKAYSSESQFNVAEGM